MTYIVEILAWFAIGCAIPLIGDRIFEQRQARENELR